MGWMKIRLTTEQIVAGEVDRVQNAFDQLFIAHHSPHAALLLGRGEADDDYELFFSPQATELAAPMLGTMGAQPCSPPPRDGTALVIGDRVAFEEVLR